MTRAVFSSLDGKNAHQKLILNQIQRAARKAARGADLVELQIMCFAFTDQVIATALIDFARTHPAAIVRLIADWSQSAHNSPSVVPSLIAAQLPNLVIKFKIDLPYERDPKSGRVRWSYRISHGMLHHKTMALCVNGSPRGLLVGSYNWSSRAVQAYENTLLITPSRRYQSTMQAFVNEFESLWRNPRLTATPGRAHNINQTARAQIAAGKSMHDLETLNFILDDFSQVPDPASRPELVSERVIPAFSARNLSDTKARRGFAPANAARKINMRRPSGEVKSVPLSLNTLALEALRAVEDGAPLKIAMYALSKRVPEYSAILEAARRGCAVRLLLDGKIGAPIAAQLRAKAKEEGLDIDLRLSKRRMHQKYVVAPEQSMVLTGTANMTEDATIRHAEHRILFYDEPLIARRFNKDFDKIWGRLAIPSHIAA